MNLTICIQAGGQSRRMGQNKALLPFAGVPLIQRIVERIRPIAAEILIISDERGRYKFLNLPILPDQIPGQGALGGLYTALFAASQPYVASIACDMPFVSPGLLRAEIELLENSRLDVAIPQTPQGLEPLHAVYRKATCLPAVEDAIRREQRRLVSWFDQVEIRVLTAEETTLHDPLQRAFININTPEDLALAEALAKQADA